MQSHKCEKHVGSASGQQEVEGSSHSMHYSAAGRQCKFLCTSSQMLTQLRLTLWAKWGPIHACMAGLGHIGTTIASADPLQCLDAH